MTQGMFCKIARFISYSFCLFAFLANSMAIFNNFTSDVKIISTKVVPSPGHVLESPTVLVCNSSAYKEPILPTTLGAYKNTTMSIHNVLVDALIVRDAWKGPLSYQPDSIKQYVKEVSTMTRGTCIMIEERFQVI